MKRISRILQLSKFIDNDPNTYHTRFEHCLGTYDKKKNIILNLYKNPEFKAYIERNNLKIYLIAELIKSGGHDIGHLPLSHVIEISVIGKREFHEVMGKRILLEDTEIHKCLDTISPNLHNALSYVLTNDVFGFELLDEGNYDIDRFDYIIRDLLYRGQDFSSNFESFDLMRIKLDKNSKPIKNNDGSFCISSSTACLSKTIPVFDISSVPTIEEFLNLRKQAYKRSYFHPITQIRDCSVAILLNELIKQKSYYATSLQHFLINLKENEDPYKIDLAEYLSWDDLKFYNELLDVAEQSKDPNLSELSTLVLPNMNSFMNMVFAILDLKNVKLQDLPKKDQDFVLRIHSIIHSNSTVSNNLKDPSFFEKTIRYTKAPEQINLLKSDTSLKPYISFSTQTLVGYKPNEPIYIRNSDGKIYTIDTLPDREFKVTSSPEQIQVAFTLLPLLNQKEVPPEKLQNILSCFNIQEKPNSFFNQTKKINMSPVQVGHNIESYFDDICI